MRWTVGRRLALAFFFIAILMAAIGAFSIYNLNWLNASTEEILQKHQPALTNMAFIERGVLFHSLKVEQYVTTGNRAHLRAVEDLRDSVETHLADLEDQTYGTEDQRLVQEIRDAYETYVSLSDEIRDFYQRNPDDAVSVAGRQMRIAALLENALLAKANALYEAKQNKAQELIGATRQLYLTAFRITIVSSAVLTLLALALSVFISRSISVPIGQLVDTTQRITGGDLTARAQVRARDEIGALASAFNTMAGQLRELIGSLEQRVAERTQELERRSAYLEATAEVGHAAASILDPDQLIQEAVELIRERFGLYYVGLFLMDVAEEWAVLQAGTGEAGQAMLARGHRIKVGEGMIGWSVAYGQPRVALEAGEDAVRLATAELPETRSEAALPLRSRGQVIGALTVQDTQPGAFDEATMTVLQTMADQVAVALDNARLFAEAQEALEAERQAYGEISRRAWDEMARARARWGYYCDQKGVFPSHGNWREEMAHAVRDRQAIVADDAAPALAIPIQVRDSVVGALNFHKENQSEAWTNEEIALLTTLAEQLGLALESARLYQDTQRRAAREQLIGQVTARMRESLDLETVLKTAAAEIREALGLEEFVVSLAPEQVDNGSDHGTDRDGRQS